MTKMCKYVFFFWSAFSHIQAEYGDLLHKSSYPGQIGQFSRSSDKSSFIETSFLVMEMVQVISA